MLNIHSFDVLLFKLFKSSFPDMIKLSHSAIFISKRCVFLKPIRISQNISFQQANIMQNVTQRHFYVV